MRPSGDQFELSGGGYRAVVTECGATLRLLEHDGRALIAGFAEDARAAGGAGQQLVPWPNRIRDGAYSFADQDQQLPISEVPLHNASHGLVRWASWHPAERGGDAIRMELRLHNQPGYPWSLRLATSYALDTDGLRVTMSATNESDSPAPFACGAHPYLSAGSPQIDGDLLGFAAKTRLLVDNQRLLPTGTESVAGTAYDFEAERPIGDLELNHAFTGLARDVDGLARVTLRRPDGSGTQLWQDERFGWVQLFSADGLGETPRSGLAVEPMTAPPDAFNSGTDLIVLAPGETFSGSWGIRAV